MKPKSLAQIEPNYPPSIEDFIFAYFQNSIEEYFQVLKSAIFFEQFKYRITTSKVEGEKRIDFSSISNRHELYELFNEKKSFLIGYYSADSNLNIISTTIRLFIKNEDKTELIKKINDLDVIYLSWDDRDNLTEILKYIAENNLIPQINNLPYLIKILSKDIPSHYLIKTYANLIKENESFFDIIKKAKEQNNDYYNDIQKNVNDSWERFYDDYISDTHGIDKTIDSEELDDIINRRKEEAIQINVDIGLESSESIIEYEFDISSQIEFNNERNSENDIKIQGYQEKAINEVLDINRLFNSNSKVRSLINPPF